MENVSLDVLDKEGKEGSLKIDTAEKMVLDEGGGGHLTEMHL